MARGAAPQAPSLLYLVKRLELVVRSRLDEMLAGTGVTVLQYTALTVLQRREGISAAGLARDSFVTPQAMMDMLHALESRGLVRRAPNPASKREKLVYLDEQGRALLARCEGGIAEIEQRMTAGLSPAEVEQFRDTVGRLRAALL